MATKILMNAHLIGDLYLILQRYELGAHGARWKEWFLWFVAGG